EGSGGEGNEDFHDVITTLERLRSGEQPLTPSAPAPEPAAVAVDEPEVARDDDAHRVAETADSDAEPSDVDEAATADKPVEAEPIAAVTMPLPVAKPKQPAPAKPRSGSESRSESGDKSNNSISDTTVRLDVELLDRLMNLVGELVLARNQILQFSRSSEDSAMAAASQRLNLITTELQEGVMKTRMQPIRNAWSKLPRVVRDLSNAFGKRVNVRMDGADTELDKTILEAIKDPLTHIVRNAVDHGIESPQERVDAGKPAEGTLWLRAFHEGGQVNVEIRDDGGGINLERVKQKALSNAMATPEQLAAMNDRELTNLILLPGFSTAQKVTNVSGRGVGMDVVKTNVEKIGGTLEIQSVFGRGTTLRIKIPLTLAIVPALVVTCEGDRYAI
ncbi:MAG: chemotaxis protein CheA, partial [Planctomycetales bacterium]|nr:chemotaxis protein CheA [Planctomycetales bacterium]